MYSSRSTTQAELQCEIFIPFALAGSWSSRGSWKTSDYRTHVIFNETTNTSRLDFREFLCFKYNNKKIVKFLDPRFLVRLHKAKLDFALISLTDFLTVNCFSHVFLLLHDYSYQQHY